MNVRVSFHPPNKYGVSSIAARDPLTCASQLVDDTREWSPITMRSIAEDMSILQLNSQKWSNMKFWLEDEYDAVKFDLVTWHDIDTGKDTRSLEPSRGRQLKWGSIDTNDQTKLIWFHVTALVVRGKLENNKPIYAQPDYNFGNIFFHLIFFEEMMKLTNMIARAGNWSFFGGCGLQASLRCRWSW